MPPAGYTCVGACPLPEDPSPKLQAYAVIVRPGIAEELPASNVIVCDEVGASCVEVNAAVGVSAEIVIPFDAVAV